ncbi:hypothetical protein [Streptomyces sp. NPDC005573]|uniref:hypothetical protein n=1 Tax=Streptomyces sp. NPDC005573 TaxID=3156890 RepID=UPI0033B019F6
MDITRAAATSRQDDDRDDDRLVRTVAWWGLGLLLPMAVLSGLMTLTSPRAAECLEYGDDCASVPDGLLSSSFWATLVCGLLAVLLPLASRTGVRLAAVLAQWGAQLTLCALILSYA